MFLMLHCLRLGFLISNMTIFAKSIIAFYLRSTLYLSQVELQGPHWKIVYLSRKVAFWKLETRQGIKISSTYLESAANFTSDRCGFVIL